MCFSPYLGVGGGGGAIGLGHNLLMQFSRLSSSKKVVPNEEIGSDVGVSIVWERGVFIPFLCPHCLLFLGAILEGGKNQDSRVYSPQK